NKIEHRLQELLSIKKNIDELKNLNLLIKNKKQELEIAEKELNHLKEKKDEYHKKVKKLRSLNESISKGKNEYEKINKDINDLKIKEKDIIAYHEHQEALNKIDFEIKIKRDKIRELDKRKKQIEDSYNNIMQDYTAIILEKNNEINNLLKEGTELEDQFLEFEKFYFQEILNIINQSLKKQLFLLNNQFLVFLIGSILSFFIFMVFSLIFNPFYLIGSFISIIILCLFLIKKWMNRSIVNNKNKSKIIDNLKSHLEKIPKYPERIVTVESIPDPNEIAILKDILMEQIENLDKITSNNFKNPLLLFSNSKNISLEMLDRVNNEILEKSDKLSIIRQRIESLRKDIEQITDKKRNLENKYLNQKGEIDEEINDNINKLKILENDYQKQIDNYNSLNLKKPDISLNEVKQLIGEKQEKSIRIRENIRKSEEDLIELEKDIKSIKINTIEDNILKLENSLKDLKQKLEGYQENQRKFLNELKIIENENDYYQLNIEINNLNKEINQIKTNISNKKNENNRILRELGIYLEPMDLDNEVKIIEFTNEIIKKIDKPHSLKTFDEYNSFYSKIPLYLNYKEEYKNIFDSIKKDEHNLAEMEQRQKSFYELKTSILKGLPDRYKEKNIIFKDDYKNIISKIEILKEKISKIEDFLAKNDVNEFEKNKKICLEKLEKAENETKSIKQSIQNNEKILNDLKNRAPKDYNKDGFSIDIILNRYDNKSNEINKKIVENRTKNTQIWNNYRKELTNTIYLLKNLEFFNEKEIKMPQIIYENTNEILKKLDELLNDLKNILDENREKILKLVNIEGFIENINELYNNTIKNWEKEKGRHEKIIENSRNQINELKHNRQKNKIIESENILIEDIESEYNNIKEEREIIENAIDILKEGEINISQKVLPKTTEILSRILPILTADRYKDAIITEDYEIKIFDSRLGNYVSKKLFSGGTNDQIALAFRLAFAMATIKDDNYGESFIFLDEPIGFFDDERRSSLINFLTSGIITKKFAQRIVVSNFLDIEQYFNYIIELDNGKIINQIATGSLETIQFDESYIPSIKNKFLDLIIKETLEEDGYCEKSIILKNISDKNIEFIQIKKLDQNLNLNIIPTYIYNLNSNDETPINLEFHKDNLNEDNIIIDAYIRYFENNEVKNIKERFEINPFQNQNQIR
ncbi:MAG: hypothetical protein ACTSRP_13740, partial [Candidatus Helarchaeota archaeon]